jgi:DNA polymerase III subunit beta
MVQQDNTQLRKNFQVNSKKLLELLTRSMKIIQPKSPISMYSSGLLEVLNNQLSITVTDMDHTLITSMEVDGDDLKFIIKVQDLFEIVKKMSGKITIYKESNRISIEGENSKIELFLMEEDFFKVNLDKVTHITTLEINDFIKLFTFLPMTNEEWSFIFQINNNYMEAIASDKKRLIFSQISSHTVNSEHFPISLKTLNLLSKHINGTLEIYQQQSQLIFKFFDGVLWSRFSNIPAINHNRILNKKQQGILVLVNKKILLDSLNRVSLLSSHISKIVKIVFDNNKIILSASDASRGQAEESIEVESTANGNLAINYEFFIHAIKTIDSTNIELYYTGQTSHFFVCSHNTQNLIIHVIMPIVYS